MNVSHIVCVRVRVCLPVFVCPFEGGQLDVSEEEEEGGRLRDDDEPETDHV